MKVYPDWVKEKCSACVFEVGDLCRREIIKGNNKHKVGEYRIVRFPYGQYAPACSFFYKAELRAKS